ncbi:MAG: phospholipase D-like domain-containing protein [Planctomycetota bacterium]
MSTRRSPAKQRRLRASLRRTGLLPRPRALRGLLRLAENLPTHGNDVELFFDGDQLFDRMLADIAAATTRVSLEMYMFLSDETGMRFARALAAKARTGVMVRVIVDAVGSFAAANRMFSDMQTAGVEVLVYHPIAPWRQRFALFGRDHRKILVIDGRIGYTGGVNIADLWTQRAPKGKPWRDTHARVAGPAAGDLELLFVETWHRETGKLLPLERTIPREPLVPPASEGSIPQVYVIGSRGGLHTRIRRMYLIAIEHARQRIRITSSYFVPDGRIRAALYAARARGVDISLLLPFESDVQIVNHASRYYFHGYLSRRLKISLWRPSILHAKTMTVDDDWSTIGSSNFDSFSFHRNLEANVFIVDPRIGQELAKRFAEDLAESTPVELAEWRKRSLLERILQRLAAMLRPWL